MGGHMVSCTPSTRSVWVITNFAWMISSCLDKLKPVVHVKQNVRFSSFFFKIKSLVYLQCPHLSSSSFVRHVSEFRFKNAIGVDHQMCFFFTRIRCVISSSAIKNLIHAGDDKSRRLYFSLCIFRERSVNLIN